MPSSKKTTLFDKLNRGAVSIENREVLIGSSARPVWFSTVIVHLPRVSPAFRRADMDPVNEDGYMLRRRNSVCGIGFVLYSDDVGNMSNDQLLGDTDLPVIADLFEAIRLRVSRVYINDL